MSGNQPQQPPRCEECGQEKLPEEISLTDSSGSQISSKTGWSTKLILSTPLESLGLGGVSSENGETIEQTETNSTNDAFMEKKTFLICSNIDCDEHSDVVVDIVGWKYRVHPNKKYSPDKVREEAKKRLAVEREINNIDIDLSSENQETPVTNAPENSDHDSSNSATDEQTNAAADRSGDNDSTDKQTDTTPGFGDRIRNWWSDNRVRRWVSSDSDDGSTTDDSTATTATNSTEKQSTQATNEQTSLWEYATKTKTGLSDGQVGQDSTADIDTGTGMGSSTSESEDFDNDRSNSL